MNTEIIDRSKILERPYWFYNRLQLKQNILDFCFTIDYGFVYVLKKIIFRSAIISDTSPSTPGYPGSIKQPNLYPVNIFLIQHSLSRNLQSDFYNPALISSPACIGEEKIVASPNIQDASGVNFSPSVPVKNYVNVDVMYRNRETIWIRLQATPPPQNTGLDFNGAYNWIDLLLAGYYIPEQSLKVGQQ